MSFVLLLGLRTISRSPIFGVVPLRNRSLTVAARISAVRVSKRWIAEALGAVFEDDDGDVVGLSGVFGEGAHAGLDGVMNFTA